MVNIKDFGAAGDGLIDDTDAIRAAFEAAGYEQAVFFPTGTYRVNGFFDRPWLGDPDAPDDDDER